MNKTCLEILRCLIIEQKMLNLKYKIHVATSCTKQSFKNGCNK